VKELDGFAYIPVENIISHMIAPGFEFFPFQKDSDWKNDDGEYNGTFFRYLHSKLKKMKERSEVPEDVRVLLIRMRSDRFQVYHIKVDNEHNNPQLFTITLMKAKDCTTKLKHLTLPFALGFKKKDHSIVLNKLLLEVVQLKECKHGSLGRKDVWPRQLSCFRLLCKTILKRFAIQ